MPTAKQYFISPCNKRLLTVLNHDLTHHLGYIIFHHIIGISNLNRYDINSQNLQDYGPDWLSKGDKYFIILSFFKIFFFINKCVYLFDVENKTDVYEAAAFIALLLSLISTVQGRPMISHVH